MHFMLKSKGIKVIYMGSAVPIKDVKYLVEKDAVPFWLNNPSSNISQILL